MVFQLVSPELSHDVLVAAGADVTWRPDSTSMPQVTSSFLCLALYCSTPWCLSPTVLLIFQGFLCGLSSSKVVRLSMWQLASENTTAEMARPFLMWRPSTGTASLLPILVVKDHLDSMWREGTTEQPACWEAWFIRGGLW